MNCPPYVFTFLVAVSCCDTNALEPTEITVGSVEGPNWSLDAIRITIDFAAADGPRAEVNVRHVRLPSRLGAFADVNIRCPVVRIRPHDLTCIGGRLRARSGGTGPIDVAFGFRYQVRERRLHFDVSEAAYAGGRMRMSGALSSTGFEIAASGEALGLSAMSEILKPLTDMASDVAIDAGTLDFTSRWRMTSADGISGSVSATIRDLAFSDASGRLAGEALAGDLEFEAARVSTTDAWQTDVTLNVIGGGVYAEPVYIDFSRHPLSTRVAAILDVETGAITLPEFRLKQPGVVEMHGRLASSPEHTLEDLELVIETARFPNAYDTYLKGVLIGTPFDSLDTAGSISARLEIQAGTPQKLELIVGTLNLEDRDGRFALYGGRGDLRWRQDEQGSAASHFAFDGGFVYGAGFDASRFDLRLAGTRAELIEPARIPTLGGALEIKTFAISDWDCEDIAVGFEAVLEPIELRQLTVALGWPDFAGTLSGHLPLLQYKNGIVTLGGTLEARAFDGDIRIEDLTIEQPFGIVPAISATLRFRDLDLALITEVFSFGSIIGRLDADIEDLEMLKGEPIAFNARFHTPEGDRSKRRISQRAVGTISKVAGGSSAVLSSTFLRMVKNFPYDRLGISCRLERDVCHMDGIAPADGGYYIVKGRLLPRLDLIGRVRAVNWSRLMSQLRKALEEGQLAID